MSNYTCHAFHDDLPNGRSSGVLEVGKDILTFNVLDNTITFPVEGLTVNMGGANNRLIFFSHQRHPDWQMYVSDRSILTEANLLQHTDIASMLNKAKRSHTGVWLGLVAVAALVIAIPLLLLFRMDAITGVVAKKIPAQWEVSLGESAFSQFGVNKIQIPRERSDPLVEPLVAPLEQQINASRYSYRYHIVKDSTINAFALPGGIIVINSGLILESENVAELLGVIAHELMHVESQHGIRNVMGSAGIYLLVGAAFGDLSGVMALLAGAAPLLLNQSYSRRYEKEADTLGFELLVRAGIDPRGLKQFFQKLKTNERRRLEDAGVESTSDIADGVMSYLSTHPATDTRIAYLEELIDTADIQIQQSPIELTQAFVNLQDAVNVFLQKESSEGEVDEK